MMRPFNHRRIDDLSRRVEALRQREHTGVITLPKGQFEIARQTWPRAAEGECGVLLAPAQMMVDEWQAKHSPTPPVTEQPPHVE